jgi:hypothetical protein
MFTRTGLSAFVLYRQKALTSYPRRNIAHIYKANHKWRIVECTNLSILYIFEIRLDHILHNERYHCLLLLQKSDASRPYITFSHNGEKAFLLGEFSDWKKCQKNLKNTLSLNFTRRPLRKFYYLRIREAISERN